MTGTDISNHGQLRRGPPNREGEEPVGGTCAEVTIQYLLLGVLFRGRVTQ